MIDKTLSHTQYYHVDLIKMVLATRVCRGWGSRSWTRASSCWKKLVWQLVSFQWLRRKIYSLLHNYYPSSPNILNCRKSSPDQPVKEVKKFWGPVQVLLHCESAKLKMDGASETDFLMGTVPQLEPAILQLFSVCKDVLPHIHRARTRRRALADISTPQPPWLAFDATCSSASTWYQAKDEIFTNRSCLKSLPVQHQIVALLREELGPVTNDGDAVLCLGQAKLPSLKINIQH